MKVGELRKQGFKAIADDTLTNGLSDSIKLSIGGAVAVNEGHHDELEVVDLPWRDKTSEEHGFLGAADYSLDGWSPYFGSPPTTDKPAAAIDEKPVFTQAMADAGELPPVGSYVFFEGDNVLIQGYTKSGHPIFEREDGMVDSFTAHSKYKPIDTRTERQKTVSVAVDAVQKKGFIANDLLAAAEAFGIAFDAGLLHLQSNEQ